ncbi:MAG: type II toxin-antitoxin system death-on-curing family toxin [Cyanobacteria bacterium J06638_7]
MATPSAFALRGDGRIELRLISRAEAVRLHDLVLAKDGGLAGVRDNNALESALYAPARYLYYANPSATLPELAAVMAYAFAKGQHPFVDGNKRTAALLVPVFLRAHGIKWRPGHEELISKMLAIARAKSDETSRQQVIEATAFWIQLSEAEYAS